MKCKYCSNQAEGVLLGYYHDGGGFISKPENVCSECGTMYHDPEPDRITYDDMDPRPSVYVHGITTNEVTRAMEFIEYFTRPQS